MRQKEIEAQLRDPKSEYFLDPAGLRRRWQSKYADAMREELEERDYYIEKNVFWVPALARWKTLQDSAKLPPGTEIEVKNGKTSTYKITSTGKLIDDALDAVEKENPKLKNVLNKNYTQLQIDPANLSGLIDLIATIPFEHADLHAKDILGHVYEYFLGQFALAEGKKGGQYFTPKSIVSLIVADARALPGPRLRPGHGLRRLLRPERALHRGTRRQAGQPLRLRAGEQPHHLAPRRDEHGHPRHRLQFRQGTGQHLYQRPTAL